MKFVAHLLTLSLAVPASAGFILTESIDKLSAEAQAEVTSRVRTIVISLDGIFMKKTNSVVHEAPYCQDRSPYDRDFTRTSFYMDGIEFHGMNSSNEVTMMGWNAERTRYSGAKFKITKIEVNRGLSGCGVTGVVLENVSPASCNSMPRAGAERIVFNKNAIWVWGGRGGRALPTPFGDKYNMPWNSVAVINGLVDYVASQMPKSVCSGNR